MIIPSYTIIWETRVVITFEFQVIDGGILVSLCHQPMERKLIVNIIKASLEKSGVLGKAGE